MLQAVLTSLSTGTPAEDDLKLLTALGVTVSQLNGYLDVIKCTLVDCSGEDDNSDITHRLNNALRRVSIETSDDAHHEATMGLLVESTLCMAGADASSWANTWSNCIKFMHQKKSVPMAKDVVPTSLGELLESAETIDNTLPAKINTAEHAESKSKSVKQEVSWYHCLIVFCVDSVLTVLTMFINLSTIKLARRYLEHITYNINPMVLWQ